MIPINEAEICLPDWERLRDRPFISDPKLQCEAEFRLGIYRLGPYVGPDQITDEMIDQLYEPDVIRIAEAQARVYRELEQAARNWRSIVKSRMVN
ncbi:MAG: hypothetical protein ACREDR_39840 [Blastocatellia bacterium]